MNRPRWAGRASAGIDFGAEKPEALNVFERMSRAANGIRNLIHAVGGSWDAIHVLVLLLLEP